MLAKQKSFVDMMVISFDGSHVNDTVLYVYLFIYLFFTPI
jgi:hypothetical protein